MELKYIAPDLRRLDESPAEVLCACVFEDERPPRGLAELVSWRLAGRVDRLIETGFLTGKRGEVMLLPGRPRLFADKVLLFGMGPQSLFEPGVFDLVSERILRAVHDLCARTAIVELPGRHTDSLTPEEAADRFLAAAAPRDGSFDSFVLVEKPAAQKRIQQHVIEARRRVRRM